MRREKFKGELFVYLLLNLEGIFYSEVERFEDVRKVAILTDAEGLREKCEARVEKDLCSVKIKKTDGVF